VKLCAIDQYVSSNACAACPAGTLRNAGDNPDGADTACTTCAADYYVSAGGVCTVCSASRVTFRPEELRRVRTRRRSIRRLSS
jgi:hypothetical protein